MKIRLEKEIKDGYVMRNYRLLRSCINCKHCFIMEWDSQDELYCTKDAPKRPLCGSVHMNEYFGDIWEKEIEIKEEKEKRTLSVDERREIILNICEHYRCLWEKWSKERMVQCNAICDSYEEL